MSRQFSQFEQQTLALAGVAQAARLVDQVSRTGTYPIEFLESSIHSLFEFEADDAAAIFGGVAGVKLGLNNLSAMLANRQGEETRDMVRYVFNLLYLERKFAASEEMMAVVHSRLQHASFKAEHFAGHVNDVCHSVSGIYQDTLSKLRFRIKVSGSAQHLQDRQNADIIRAVLLAGLRSAFLWRQLGGRRWKLILQRKHLLQTAQNLSRDLPLV
ncbi:high frequency lysogenization protein HflD [Pseudohalioglobus lutimaris]|uniref:High frequency lysogenization protein HflD homolog n=1 Tax=Pseudohalioglobus lutimaris TaxID=1737061 RepID=A0A2N5WXB7_9GAMM|nr:high frequency lysogenization protein HflD [Pseudohalioglobus lutimaris]PLW66866.1 lysogenization regulator HflD [Pseudohalioglobus lutimaris]